MLSTISSVAKPVFGSIFSAVNVILLIQKTKLKIQKKFIFHLPCLVGRQAGRQHQPFPIFH
ncbi:MAG: hypothetical protein A2080_02160 [Ignavibacteria bacterium GWC2_36_12]|nr:MAG: hypothetical protein A2080_02160 [Ignavibacteria bacterium GWC2_36_12]